MSNGIKEWVISDTHFFHKNVLKYEDRPFESVEEMNEEIIKRWNSVVGKYDKVYHLGDFAMTSMEEIKTLVSRLHGNIILVKGNHDTRSNKAYYDAGFFEVSSYPIIKKAENLTMVFSHHPLYENELDSVVNIHGHVHGNKDYKKTNYNFNVSCEVINYTPIDINSFMLK